jgi:hypothetical protein
MSSVMMPSLTFKFENKQKLNLTYYACCLNWGLWRDGEREREREREISSSVETSNIFFAIDTDSRQQQVT